MQDTNLRPSKRYLAKALSYRGVFVAQFSLPGLAPDFVRESGKILTYTTEEPARYAAMKTVIQMANDRLALRLVFKDRAAVMSAAALSKLLDEIGMTPSEAGHLLQTDNVMEWLGGERRMPHTARLLLEMMRDPAIRQQAEALTAAAIKEGEINAPV